VRTVSISEAKAQLSKLVDEAAKGEPFVIAKGGEPLMKVTALEAPVGTEAKRLGFLSGHISVPDDFDCMGAAEIDRMFTGRK